CAFSLLTICLRTAETQQVSGPFFGIVAPSNKSPHNPEHKFSQACAPCQLLWPAAYRCCSFTLGFRVVWLQGNQAKAFGIFEANPFANLGSPRFERFFRIPIFKLAAVLAQGLELDVYRL